MECIYKIVVINNGLQSINQSDYGFSEISIENYVVENRGFGAAVNHGIEIAIRDNAEYIWTLNIDIELSKETLSNLLPALQLDTITGSVIHEKENGKDIFQCGTDGLNSWRGYKAVVKPKLGGKLRVGAVPGTSMVIGRKVFSQVKFDEEYFMYVEENDYCYRAEKKGFLSYIALDSVVSHTSGGSFNNKPDRWYYKVRNLLRFKRNQLSNKNYILAVYLFFITVRVHGFNKEYLKKYLMGVRDYLNSRFGIMDGRVQLCYIGATPAYYFVPFIKELAKEPAINLEVLWLSDEALKSYHEKDFGLEMKAENGLTDGYRCFFEKNLLGKNTYQKGFWHLNSIGPVLKIFCLKYDFVIVHGWQYITNIMVIIACFFTRTKILMRAETPLNQELNKPIWKKLIRKIIFKFMFHLIDGFLFIGNQNRYFYKYYGVSDKKLFFTPYAVDNQAIGKKIKDATLVQDSLLSKYKLPSDKVIILFVGKLQHKKRPLILVDAFNRMVNKDNCALVIVGSGELEEKIKSEISGIDNVILLGYKTQDEIFEVLSLANIFVLPSGNGETWGLVVNEALNAGLPVILSDRVGSSSDLISNDNGIIFKLDSVNELTSALDHLSTNRNLRAEMGRKSLELLNIYNSTTIVNGILSAISEISGSVINHSISTKAVKY